MDYEGQDWLLFGGNGRSYDTTPFCDSGFLGVKRMDGSVTYAYNVNYEMPILRGITKKLAEHGLVSVVNPAFVQGLQVREDQPT